MYDHVNNLWIPCKMVSIKNKSYKVSIKDGQTFILPMNTMKLRKCACLRCITGKQGNTQFGYQVINEAEKKLLSYKISLINPNQLYNVYDVDLTNNLPLVTYYNASKYFGRNVLFKGTSSIYCEHKGS